MSLQSSFRKRLTRARSHTGTKPHKHAGGLSIMPPTPLKKHDTPRSPHKEHGPKGKGQHQGVGQAAHAGKIHAGLAGIFTGKYEGAGLMQNAPRPGFNVSIAGNSQDIRRRFQNLEDVDGVWEGEKEQSYMANLPRDTKGHRVLRAAAAAGKANDQDAVFVRFDDARNRPPGNWDKGVAYSIETPQGFIDVVDSKPPFSIPPDNVEDAIKLAKRYGGGQVKRKFIWTRLLERGKHY